MLRVICDCCENKIDEYETKKWSITMLQYIMNLDNHLCNKCWIQKEKNRQKIIKDTIQKKIKKD